MSYPFFHLKSATGQELPGSAISTLCWARDEGRGVEELPCR